MENTHNIILAAVTVLHLFFYVCRCELLVGVVPNDGYVTKPSAHESRKWPGFDKGIDAKTK